MNFRSLSAKTLLVLALVSFSIPQIAKAYDRSSPWWLQGDLSAGYQEIDPDVPNELKKGGFLLGGRGLLEYRTDSYGAFGLGLGLQQTWQDGETDVRYQKYILRSLLVDASYLYPFMSRFLWVGWLFRTQVGEGAQFDFFGDISSLQTLGTTGPQVRLNFATERWDWVVGIAALRAVNSTDRTITNIPIYAGISIPLSCAKTTSTSSAKSAKAVTAHTRTRTVLFALDSAELNEKAKLFLSGYARALKQHPNDWETIAITGHTDITGRSSYNQPLSRKRSEAVKRFLVLVGIPANRITTAGFGADKRISDIDAWSALNRRAELSLEGVLGVDLLNDLNKISDEG